MNDQINSTIKSVMELKSGIGLFSKELDKIHSQLEELRSILASKQTVESAPAQQISTPTQTVKKQNVVVRREDQEEVELLDNKGYQIHVVGLGVQKLD
jgi:regulator of replication initiation timing